MTRPPAPYNPLDTANLAESVASTLAEKDPEDLPPPDSFVGPGVYAIYYTGQFAAYQAIAQANSETPIYVGKAVRPGSRSGGAGLEAPKSTNALYQRLRQHARSISEAHNLELPDFRCRYLVVEDVWIPLAESHLIRLHRPLWNNVLSGFGIHDPGGRRKLQWRSHWDELHPGRGFAKDLPTGDVSADELTVLARDYLDSASSG